MTHLVPWQVRVLSYQYGAQLSLRVSLTVLDKLDRLFLIPAFTVGSVTVTVDIC